MLDAKAVQPRCHGMRRLVVGCTEPFALLTHWDRATPSRRDFRRWSVELSALGEIDSETHYCTIRDVSPRGACILLVRDILVAAGTACSLSTIISANCHQKYRQRTLTARHAWGISIMSTNQKTQYELELGVTRLIGLGLAAAPHHRNADG